MLTRRIYTPWRIKTIFCRELAVVNEIEENLGNRIAALHGESAVEVFAASN